LRFLLFWQNKQKERSPNRDSIKLEDEQFAKITISNPFGALAIGHGNYFPQQVWKDYISTHTFSSEFRLFLILLLNGIRLHLKARDLVLTDHQCPGLHSCLFGLDEATFRIFGLVIVFSLAPSPIWRNSIQNVLKVKKLIDVYI
jgi:hypothetical protein